MVLPFKFNVNYSDQFALPYKKSSDLVATLDYEWLLMSFVVGNLRAVYGKTVRNLMFSAENLFEISQTTLP